MKKKDMNAAVIGAGISGLTTAAALAKMGVKVTIFEKNDKAGGIVDTFTHNGYTFEATTHQTVGFSKNGYIKPVLNKLSITDLPITESKNLFTTIYIKNNIISKIYELPTGIDNFIQALCSYFPAESDAIHRFIKMIQNITHDVLRLQDVIRLIKINPIDLIGAILLVKSSEGSIVNRLSSLIYKNYYRVKDKTYQELTSDFSTELQSLLSQFWMYTGENPKSASGALICLILTMFAKESPMLLKGGMKILNEKLLSIIKENNGEIFYNSEVKKVILSSNRIESIKLSNGNIYKTNYLISSISTHALFSNLFDAKSLPSEYETSIKNLKLSPGFFQTYLGVPFCLKDYGIKNETTFFNYSYTTDYTGIPGSDTPFELTNFTAFDKNYAPEGHSSFVIFEIDDTERWKNLTHKQYEKQKKETQNIQIDKLEKITNMPIRKKAKVIFSATPKTLKHYMGSTNGEAFGPASTVAQSLEKQTSFQTPIPNLFLTGTYSYSSPGISSSIDNSYVIAKQSLLLMKIIKKVKGNT